jgi:hypothetical protein
VASQMISRLSRYVQVNAMLMTDRSESRRIGRTGSGMWGSTGFGVG